MKLGPQHRYASATLMMLPPEHLAILTRIVRLRGKQYAAIELGTTVTTVVRLLNRPAMSSTVERVQRALDEHEDDMVTNPRHGARHAAFRHNDEALKPESLAKLARMVATIGRPRTARVLGTTPMTIDKIEDGAKTLAPTIRRIEEAIAAYVEVPVIRTSDILVGAVYRQWTVLEKLPNKPNQGAMVLCSCSCGRTVKPVREADLRNGVAMMCRKCALAKCTAKMGMPLSQSVGMYERE